jgi:hypothetical protein
MTITLQKASLDICRVIASYRRKAKTPAVATSNKMRITFIGRSLQHSRQIRTPGRALIVHATGFFLWAIGSQFIEPIDEFGIAATTINEAG